jgi:serine/threonine protein phosphatase PrpC
MHREQRAPNEDAVLVGRVGSTAFAVVCDGVGSRVNAAVGAWAGCLAVRDAAEQWTERGDAGAEPAELLELVDQCWRRRIGMRSAASCATTCLFATVLPSGRAVYAQLGDGLVGLAQGDGRFAALRKQDREFGILSGALGSMSEPDAWYVESLPALPERAVLLLATDGVANDLVPGREGEFARRLISSLSDLPLAAARRALAETLIRWPTPRHLDDKTVALLWRPPAPAA